MHLQDQQVVVVLAHQTQVLPQLSDHHRLLLICLGHVCDFEKNDLFEGIPPADLCGASSRVQDYMWAQVRCAGHNNCQTDQHHGCSYYELSSSELAWRPSKSGSVKVL